MARARSTRMRRVDTALKQVLAEAISRELSDPRLGFVTITHVEATQDVREAKVWFTTLQVGTWTNGTAGLAGALLGYSSILMPTINEKFPAPRGADHPAVTGLLQLCGVAIMICLLLTLFGLVRPRSSERQ